MEVKRDEGIRKGPWKAEVDEVLLNDMMKRQAWKLERSGDRERMRH